MPNPPEDEGLHVVQRNEPEPHLIYGNIARPEQPIAVGPARSFSLSVTVFIGIFIVLVLVGIFAWIRFSGRNVEHRQPVIGEERLDKPSPAGTSSPSLSVARRSTVPVLPDMLRVTSIAMGKVPLAIVNGKRLAEGDQLEVKTNQGIGVVQIEKIEDGAVHFRNGETAFESKLLSPSPSQRPH